MLVVVLYSNRNSAPEKDAAKKTAKEEENKCLDQLSRGTLRRGCVCAG